MKMMQPKWERRFPEREGYYWAITVEDLPETKPTPIIVKIRFGAEMWECHFFLPHPFDHLKGIAAIMEHIEFFGHRIRPPYVSKGLLERE